MYNLLNACSWVGLCCLCEVIIDIEQVGNTFTGISMRNLQLFPPPHRNREIKQMKDCMKNGNSFSFLSHDINELEHSYQLNLPRVTVIMPLKGFGEHNLHNWRSQVITYITHAPGIYFRFPSFWFLCSAFLVLSQVIVIHYK